MKKITVFVLAALLTLLCSCGGGRDVIRTYSEESGVPAHMVRLDPNDPEDTQTAVLLCRYDGTAAKIAVASDPSADPVTVYEATENTLTYEIAAGDGLIAFYELTVYTDGSVGYALKVIDTANGNKVHTPFKKTVDGQTGRQTRFICVYGGCVYYLTESALLGRCRVMRYKASDGSLDEYLSFPLTGNEASGGSSCTFISEKSGYLSCGTIDGSRCTIKTYDLSTGELFLEKDLPYAVVMVYAAEYDPMTGMYALYYLSAQNDERIGLMTFSDERITDVLTLGENVYLNREEITLYNDLLIFSTQDQSKSDDPYRAFTAHVVNVADAAEKLYEGCFEILSSGGSVYTLSFDKKAGYSKILLAGRDIG